MARPFPLWDLPTRIFHWLLVAGVALCWWTGEEGEFERHEWLGYSILVVVGFRVIWGFVGSRHSRFTDFLVGPRAAFAYLRGRGVAGPGHNPLGGWSVFLMLSLLLLQGFSGLFNSDDLLFTGPFHYAASVEFRDAMGVVHEWAFNVITGLIALHVAAVLFHQFARRERLIQAMLRGSAEGREGESPPVPWWPALLILLALALLLWGALSAAPQPESMW